MRVERFAERLREERVDVVDALERLKASVGVSQLEGGGEAALVDQHLADVATDTELRELDVGQRLVLEDRLVRIDEALKRIDRGMYGRCVVCGTDIPEERLGVLPETPYCLTHASRNAAQRPHERGPGAPR